MPWTTVGAGEAVAATEGRMVGTLGSEAMAAAGEVTAAGELGLVAELGPAAELGPTATAAL